MARRIETDIYVPHPEKPGYVLRQGGRPAVEVFRELESELKAVGYCPDEYFLLNDRWKDGREFPEEGYLHAEVGYGGNEGIYLTLTMEDYDQEEEKYKHTPFATGKTLGESDSDLERMHLVAAKITNLFYGGGVHARYVRLGEDEQPESIILHLSEAERRIMADSLVEHRNRALEDVDATEQLLRRMTGNILEYVDMAGSRPLRLNHFDKASLAIRDGDARAFKGLAAIVEGEQERRDLLVQAAGRPGKAGRHMMDTMLELAKPVTAQCFEAACEAAVKTAEAERVLALLERADADLDPPCPELPGKVMLFALRQHDGDSSRITAAILERCSEEQVRAAPPSLLEMSAYDRNHHIAEGLVKKGLDCNPGAARYIRWVWAQQNAWMVDNLFRRGMQIDPDNYPVMAQCVETGLTDAAKCLLDQGMDLDSYQTWAMEHSSQARPMDPATLKELRAYAAGMQQEAETDQAGQDSPSPGM